jgi:hypothetical protein
VVNSPLFSVRDNWLATDANPIGAVLKAQGLRE